MGKLYFNYLLYFSVKEQVYSPRKPHREPLSGSEVRVSDLTVLDLVDLSEQLTSATDLESQACQPVLAPRVHRDPQ